MEPSKINQRTVAGDQLEQPFEEMVAEGVTAWQRYAFFDTAAHGRCVMLDGDIQSCAIDEAIYHEALVHPAMLTHPAPRRVLIMGGGEGATAREVLRHAAVERVVMVDIDAEFVSLCRTHLDQWHGAVFDDARLSVKLEDIYVHLDKQTDLYDVIIGDLVDVTAPDSAAQAFYSPRFYEQLARKLAPGGLIATQAGGLMVGQQQAWQSIQTSLSEAFGAARGYGMTVPSFYHLWGFVLAGAGVKDLEALPLERFNAVAKARGLALPATGPDALAAAFALPRALGGDLE